MPAPLAAGAAAAGGGKLAGLLGKLGKLAKSTKGLRTAARFMPGGGRKRKRRWPKVVAVLLCSMFLVPVLALLAFLTIAEHVLSALQVKPTLHVALDAYRAAEECPFATDTTVGHAAGAAYLVASAWTLTGDDVIPGGVFGGYQNPFASPSFIPEDMRALADPTELAPGGSVHEELQLRGTYHLEDWTTALGATRRFGIWYPNLPPGGEHGVGFLLIRPSNWRAWVSDVHINLTRKLDPWRPYDAFLVMACHLQALEKQAGTGPEGVVQALAQYGDEAGVQLVDTIADAPGRILHDVASIFSRLLDMVVGLGSAFANRVLIFMGQVQDLLGLGQSMPSDFAKKDIPADYLALIRQWAAPDLDWTILAGVLRVECNFGRDTDGSGHCVSSAGAIGPAQFMPGTFAQYAVDGDHDGRLDIRDPADAVASAANYLRHLGLGNLATVRSALCHYNTGPAMSGEFNRCMNGTQGTSNYCGATVHSYADGVMDCATKYRGHVDFGSALTALAPTVAAQVALLFAIKQIGLPYIWGGNGPQHGDAGFDCSGLTHAAYASAGIQIPRLASDQFKAGPRVAPGSPIMPGDLVFFVGALQPGETPPGHVGMAISSTEMVDAPHTGAFVRREPIWHDGFMGATRPSVRG
jgi:hypothetical protein